jgi:hypothetical protein
MAAAAVITTQRGTPAVGGCPNSAMSIRVMTPIVFCPSLEPWEKETAAPERMVIHRKLFGGLPPLT